MLFESAAFQMSSLRWIQGEIYQKYISVGSIFSDNIIVYLDLMKVCDNTKNFYMKNFSK